MYSNFITPPDYVESILILNATHEQMQALAKQIQELDNCYNIYFYSEEMNNISWFHKISLKVDVVLDAKIKDPQEYFNK
jgi:hypothetical protein